jgi:hypothetical protein
MKRVSKLLFPAAMMLLLCGFGPCEQVALNGPTPAEDCGHPADLAARTDAASTATAFFPDIQNDIDTLGCSSQGCHARSLGVAPLLIPNPTTQADQDANYASFTSDCNPSDPAMSAIIQAAIGMDDHTGGVVFAAGGAVYTRWVAWIADGELRGQ